MISSLRRLGVLAVVLFSLSLDAAPRRRTVSAPGVDPNTLTIAAWLHANAQVLDAIDLVPNTDDLFPLRGMIGSATIVGLGDGTHGTHEFFTVKLRVIDYLVRELNFDVVAFESPHDVMERLDAYVQGGAGDPRALLNELGDYTYFFWESQEILALVEWMREYNAHRGDRPAVHIAGFDTTVPAPNAVAVVDYLRTVDPALAVEAETKYECARAATIIIDAPCENRALNVRDTMSARAAELIALSSPAAFEEAMQRARLVAQSRYGGGLARDERMAPNALWLREHRGSTRKMILWAHSAHISEGAHPWLGEKPMGRLIAEAVGNFDYFTLTTMTAAGSFRILRLQSGGTFVLDTRPFPALQPNAYETKLRQHGAPYLLIPLRRALPAWLTTSSNYNAAGSSGHAPVTGSLPLIFDAAIFIDTTTPFHEITP